MSLQRRRIIATVLVALTLTVGIVYLINSITSPSVSVTNNTVYSWQIPAATGEASVAIDPTNPDRVVYHALGLQDNVPFYSTNGGTTWNQSTPFTIYEKTGVLDPWITYDSRGNAYASTYVGNNTHPYDWTFPFLAKSTNHGANFTLLPTSYSPPWTKWKMPDGTLKPSCAMPGPGAIDFPKVAADQSPTSPFRDYVYIVGAAGVNSTGSSLCIGITSLVRSTDGGKTWDTHSVLSGSDNQAILRPDNLAFSPNGTIYFASPYIGGGILLVYSKDGGTSWTASPLQLGFGADQPWITTSQSNSNELHIVFEKGHADNSIHIYMINSINGGATWSTAQRLDDILPDDTVDHKLPAISVSPGGRIFVAWRDFRNTPSKTAGNSNTTDIYGYSSLSPGANLRLSRSTGRYCGYLSPCYRVTGNDYFTVASNNSSDIAAFSSDEKGTLWPQAYATIFSLSGERWTSALSTVFTNIFAISAIVIGAGISVMLLLFKLMRPIRENQPEGPRDQI